VNRLAGGEVGLGHANMLGGSSIKLTCDRLVAVDRPVRAPASGSGGAPAGSSTSVREGLHGELPCDPKKVPGRSQGL
jgi:hypothetical protein